MCVLWIQINLSDITAWGAQWTGLPLVPRPILYCCTQDVWIGTCIDFKGGWTRLRSSTTHYFSRIVASSIIWLATLLVETLERFLSLRWGACVEIGQSQYFHLHHKCIMTFSSMTPGSVKDQDPIRLWPWWKYTMRYVCFKPLVCLNPLHTSLG